MILLAGAITLAAGTALVARTLMRPPPPVTIVKEVAVTRPAHREVLVAAHALVPGDFIDPNALTWHELPATDLRAGLFSASDETQHRKQEHDAYGATLRHSLAAGQPLSRDLLVYPGQPGFLAAVLAPGMRAVSIPTSMVSSNAGLVAAGDHIDLILSLKREDMTAPSEAPNSIYATLAAQTIVRDVRVLALNSDTSAIAPAAATSTAATESDGGSNGRRASARTGQRPSYDSVTLEVTPAEAEQLALVREVGTLQLALRGTREPEAILDESKGVTRLQQATSIFSDTSRPITVKTYQGAQPGSAVFSAPP